MVNKQELGGILHSCANLFKTNCENMDPEEEKVQGLELFSPKNLCKATDPDTSEATLQQMISFLTALQDKAKMQIDSMQIQLEDLQQQIKGYYTHMNSTPYYLQSMMIHDGNHMSGHYYNYIKDFSNNKYFMFNDHRVTEMEEERVRRESQGGCGTMNAYCLVYVSQQIYDQCKNKDLHRYGIQHRNTPPADIYNSWVSDDLAEQVYKQNDDLLNSIKLEEVNDKVIEIMSLYDHRIDKVTKFIEEHKNAKLQYVSSIAQFYHKAKPDSPDYSRIAKWFLLNICVIEKTGIEGGLNSLPDDDILRTKLREICSSSKHPKAPASLCLNDDDQIYCVEQVSSYPTLLKNTLIT